jgi:hypothetical protein
VERRVIHKTAILSSHEDATREIEIGSAAIDARGTRLRTRVDEILRAKNQTAGPPITRPEIRCAWEPGGKESLLSIRQDLRKGVRPARIDFATEFEAVALKARSDRVINYPPTSVL